MTRYRKLKSRLQEFEKRLWLLENPPKFVYGDKVDFRDDCYGDTRTSGTILQTKLFSGVSDGRVYYRRVCLIDIGGEVIEINQECLSRVKTKLAPNKL